MTNPFRGAVAAAFMAAAPQALLAQASAPPSAPSAPTASPSAPAASPPARSGSSPAPATQATHRSAFDGYRRFDDQKVQSWREANDQVGRIGGWRAYARESAGDETKKP